MANKNESEQQAAPGCLKQIKVEFFHETSKDLMILTRL